MRALVQRVSEGSVHIETDSYNAGISKGMVILLGIKTGDTAKDVNFLADKCSNLRIFEDEHQKMNLSVKDVNGEALIISQFTLYGDASRGNRPGFTESARPEEAIPLYKMFVDRMRENLGSEKIKEGVFGAMMTVKIFNDGPVTIMIDSK